MSTNALFFVTDGQRTARLTRIHDGYPDTTLHGLRTGLRKTSLNALDDTVRGLHDEGWLLTELDKSKDKGMFSTPFSPVMAGRYKFFEWIYLLDINAGTLSVWDAREAIPAFETMQLPSDSPMVHLNDLEDDYVEPVKVEMDESIALLEQMGIRLIMAPANKLTTVKSSTPATFAW